MNVVPSYEFYFEKGLYIKIIWVQQSLAIYLMLKKKKKVCSFEETILYTLIAFNERVTLLASTRRVSGFVHVRMLHYLRLYSRITITQLHTHPMQQTHTHKAVTGRLKPKSYSLVEGNRNYTYDFQRQLRCKPNFTGDYTVSFPGKTKITTCWKNREPQKKKKGTLNHQTHLCKEILFTIR